MTLGRRIEELRIAAGLSQAELARRVGVRQSTMNSLINGDSRSSRSIVQIARELGTTAAYLIGDTDDPRSDAPPARLRPVVQHITMQVALPSENALSDMFEGQLQAFDRLKGAELARALAKRLPKALARLQAVELYEASDDTHDDLEAAELRLPGRHEPRRVQRT
ncbi:MAG: XRE family transcriptional regulator [Oxalobacteraceae bacterium]|nr:MAG: XRE family transcriptional regulator [Oxalobacteraceae bacterium]